MNIMIRENGKVLIVFSSQTNSDTFDVVRTLGVSKQFRSGLAHFNAQKNDENDENEMD